MSRTTLRLSGIAVAALALVVLFAIRGTGGSVKYGAPIDTSKVETVELASLFEDAQSYVGKRIILDARAGQVCQTSGCWITVTDGVNLLFVQFYDFTVKLRPGARVRVQGTVRIVNNAPYLVGEGLEVTG